MSYTDRTDTDTAQAELPLHSPAIPISSPSTTTSSHITIFSPASAAAEEAGGGRSSATNLQTGPCCGRLSNTGMPMVKVGQGSMAVVQLVVAMVMLMSGSSLFISPSEAARSLLQDSYGYNTPSSSPAYASPAPVYQSPAPVVYNSPSPVYQSPAAPVYVSPAPVYYSPPAYATPSPPPAGGY